MTIEMNMTEELTDIICESEHPIKVELERKKAKISHLMKDVKEKLIYRGLVLHFKTAGNNVPRVLVENSKFAAKYQKAILCSFFPKLEEDALTEGEFIFVIDRSGSMAGSSN